MIKFFRYFKSIFILFFILLFLVSINRMIDAGSNSLIINEFMFDPVGSDSGNEWIELYNPTDQTISISNWKILIAGITFTEVSTFSGDIPSHEYFLVCEANITGCNTYVSKIALQNGGGATDALSIATNSGIVVDQVFYDTPNSNSLKNSSNIVVGNEDVAIIGTSGESLGRFNFIDSDNSFNDFYIYPTPTPGSENIGEVIDDELPQTGDSPLIWYAILLILVISGILFYRNNLYTHRNGKNS